MRKPLAYIEHRPDHADERTLTLYDFSEDQTHLRLVITEGPRRIGFTLSYSDVEALKSTFEVWSS